MGAPAVGSTTSALSDDKCPNQCSGHGACTDSGVCMCEGDFRGEDCSCTELCSMHHVCQQGKCVCAPGRTGEGCTELVQEAAEEVAGEARFKSMSSACQRSCEKRCAFYHDANSAQLDECVGGCTKLCGAF
eukprot:TRINITY_DN36856_c0_g1_i2.p4 TRINITY_DN36856_c0_g1~~TRINITY_DN36856_c0_g1_i2.p4  ORF type:complete len:131 (-),score=42.57 TRINITY_DN36856_c0_g1_i2:141-533(-)